MKNILTTVAIALGLAGPAFAGNPFPTVMEPAMTAPATTHTDWSGAYVGGVIGFDSGTYGYSTDGPYGYAPDTSYGVFAGYNVQKGPFVFGAELAFQNTELGPEITLIATPLEYFVDVKARAGYAFDNVMLYGVIGNSWSKWKTRRFPISPYDTYDISGMNYGVGVDVLITDNMFAGVEYLVRDMSGQRSDGSGVTGTSHVESAQLRVGWRF